MGISLASPGFDLSRCVPQLLVFSTSSMTLIPFVNITGRGIAYLSARAQGTSATMARVVITRNGVVISDVIDALLGHANGAIFGGIDLQSSGPIFSGSWSRFGGSVLSPIAMPIGFTTSLLVQVASDGINPVNFFATVLA